MAQPRPPDVALVASIRWFEAPLASRVDVRGSHVMESRVTAPVIGERRGRTA